MIRKVTLYTDPNDPYCTEIEKFLRGLEIDLTVYDMHARPLTVAQLRGLLRSFNLENFINPFSKSPKARELDVTGTSRKDILKLLAEDNALLIRPIIVAGRLMTAGYDRRRILTMLQMPADIMQSGQQAESAA